jgi:hypothetical protein
LKIKSTEEKKRKNLVSKMAAILFGDTKRLSMKREALDKKKLQNKPIHIQKVFFFFYYLEKSKKDWLGRCRRRRQLQWARNVFKDEWRLVSKRIMTGNKD